MRVISLGDKFPFGRFAEIYNRFDQVINFKSEDSVLSVVTNEIGAAPLHLEIDFSELSSIQTLEYQAGYIILNDSLGITVPDSLIYQSELKLEGKDNQIFVQNILALKVFLTQKQHVRGIAWLLTGQAPDMTGAFDTQLAEQFQAAYALLLRNEYVKSVKGFRSRGNGLTPAGDDFNAGLLLGLFIRQQIEKKELSKIRNGIYHNSLTKNLQCNTLLYLAYSGRVDAGWKNLVSALAMKDSGWQAAASEVIKHGETSGADTLTGFLAAWEIKI